MKSIQKVFGMTDEVWDKHSNPWSVWTRFASLPFLILAFWSAHHIGIYSLIPILILVAWLWINPRLFSRPNTQESWASKAVLGEKIWINDRDSRIINKHSTVVRFSTAISFIGFLFLIRSVYAQDVTMCLLSTIILYTGKMWFLDRMVWVYEDKK
ncbi:MAG: hypothetical protein BM556_13385 [Bacteriovorax sp. MedPE-SWde]|nr:MAG: hypothetical protein BM556_13385 [Bacteriovorax sp. MedPE-SWde]